jgi:hypothetical protein
MWFTGGAGLMALMLWLDCERDHKGNSQAAPDCTLTVSVLHLDAVNWEQHCCCGSRWQQPVLP